MFVTRILFGVININIFMGYLSNFKRFNKECKKFVSFSFSLSSVHISLLFRLLYYYSSFFEFGVAKL